MGKTFKDAKQWPNDTPLTEAGHKHATEVGQHLKKTGKPFGLIVSSPYYRCAQTASRIAQELKLPVHFDLDMGEIFDDLSMTGNCAGRAQYREPRVLEAQLKPDFPDVEWIRDAEGKIKIEGKMQKWPENFDRARMRYCYKVKKLVQKAASELMSIVIVTHGDALAAVLGLMKENWDIGKVPYTAYAICSRRVKVMEKGTNTNVAGDEPVYVHPEDWTIEVSNGFQYKTLVGHVAKQAHKVHEDEMKKMNKMSKEIHTSYKLEDDQVASYKAALSHLGAHEHDTRHMLTKATTTSWGNSSGTKRMICSPHSQDSLES